MNLYESKSLRKLFGITSFYLEAQIWLYYLALGVFFCYCLQVPAHVCLADCIFIKVRGKKLQKKTSDFYCNHWHTSLMYYWSLVWPGLTFVYIIVHIIRHMHAALVQWWYVFDWNQYLAWWIWAQITSLVSDSIGWDSGVTRSNMRTFLHIWFVGRWSTAPPHHHHHLSPIYLYFQKSIDLSAHCFLRFPWNSRCLVFKCVSWFIYVAWNGFPVNVTMNPQSGLSGSSVQLFLQSFLQRNNQVKRACHARPQNKPTLMIEDRKCNYYKIWIELCEGQSDSPDWGQRTWLGSHSCAAVDPDRVKS